MQPHLTNETVTGEQSSLQKLPEHIISRILTCLPLRDAAKLCLVSRTWHSLWQELPELRFDSEFFAEVLKVKPPTGYEFHHILSVILMSHIGPISKFYLCIPKLESSTTPDIGPCFSHLSRNDIKEITIIKLRNTRFKLSYHLFSCLNLENLKLNNCIFNFLPLKVLKNLKNVELEDVRFTGNSLPDFITNCPVLESLILKRCVGFKCIDISAPNLKYLTLSGKFESVSLTSAKNLIELTVTLEELVPNYQSDRTCELMKYLAQSCKIEKLSFGGHFCKYLTSGGVGEVLITGYCCLKYLQLSDINTGDQDECNWVLKMICQRCPVLEDLTISFSSKAASLFHFNQDFRRQMSSLRRVQLTSVMGNNLELTLIEYLLGFSPALQTFYIKRNSQIKQVDELRLTRLLMYYRRASPTATIIYLEPDSNPCDSRPSAFSFAFSFSVRVG